MSIGIPILGEHCKSCLAFFKTIESCPRSHIFEKGELFAIILEIIWVSSSLIPLLIFLGLLIHSFTKKTSRGFFIMTNIFIQQVIIALLKVYFAQPRPLGACSTSYGYPSGHSCFAASLTTWLILEIVIFHDKVPFKTQKSYYLMRNISIGFTPFIPISRYFLNYHSLEQIMFGLLTGFICTLLYFAIVMKRFISQIGEKGYDSKAVKSWIQHKFYDNLTYLSCKDEDQIDKDNDQSVSIQNHRIAHPFRDQIREFIEINQKRAFFVKMGAYKKS